MKAAFQSAMNPSLADDNTINVPPTVARKQVQPIIRVKSLANLMPNDAACWFQPWVQSNYQLLNTYGAPSDFTNYQIAHNRAVNGLQRNLRNDGLIPILGQKFRLPFEGAIVVGQVDCLVVDGDELVVYDCKTGRPWPSDDVQVMIYGAMLTELPQYQGLRSRGVLVYNDRQKPVAIPDDFLDDLRYFVAQLVAHEAPPTLAGSSCRFCPIPLEICPDRFDDPAWHSGR